MKTEEQEKKSVIPVYGVLGFILFILGFGVFMFMKFFVPDYLRRGVQEDLFNGEVKVVIAQAEIESLLDTGRRYSKVPVIQLTLNVVPENQKEFPLILEQEMSWPQVSQMAPGKKIEIRYNPENPQDAALNQDYK